MSDAIQCPKCGHQNATGSEDCPACGIIYRKYDPDREAALQNPRERRLAASKFSGTRPSKGNVRDERSSDTLQCVAVSDINMPFWSMVRFMVKWVIASIPAFIILVMIATATFSMLGGLIIR